MTQTKAELLQTRHQGDIRLGDADSTHYVGFKAPATVSSSLVWTLPAADGTANYLLKTDGSGNLGWVADSTTDSTKMPLTGGTFTGDVTFTGAAANIVFDKSDNALEFADVAKATFGTDSDFFIQFDGTNTILRGGTAPLYIQTDGTTFITKNNGTESIAKFIGDGAVELYHNNNLRLQTWSDGVNILGDEGQSGILHIYADDGDNNADKWRFEASAAGSFNLANYSTGSWVNGLTLDGSNNVTFAGTITKTGSVGNTIFKASGAELEFTRGSANAITASDSNGYLVFQTGGTNERMRIDSAGKVGIGTTSQGGFDKFVVNGTGNVIAAEAASGAVGIGLFENGTGRFYLKSLNGSDGIAFVDADNSSERMRIDSAGNIGINETTPTFSEFGSNGGGLELDDVNTGFTAVKVSQSSTHLYLVAHSSGAYVSTRSNQALVFETNSAAALTLSASQNATFAGTITGGAATFKTSQENQLTIQDSDSSHTGAGAETGIKFLDGAGTQQAIVGCHTSSSADLFIETNTNANVNIKSNNTTRLSVNANGINVTGNTVSTGTVSDSIGELRQIPQRSVSSVTLAASDVGKAVLATSTVTVPNGVFSSGDAVTIINNSGSDITISKGISTMYLASDGSSANRTLATRGMATIWFSSSSVAYISGAGLS